MDRYAEQFTTTCEYHDSASEAAERIKSLPGLDFYQNLTEERAQWKEVLASLKERNERQTAILCSSEEELNRTKATAEAIREQDKRLYSVVPTSLRGYIAEPDKYLQETVQERAFLGSKLKKIGMECKYQAIFKEFKGKRKFQKGQHKPLAKNIYRNGKRKGLWGNDCSDHDTDKMRETKTTREEGATFTIPCRKPGNVELEEEKGRIECLEEQGKEQVAKGTSLLLDASPPVNPSEKSALGEEKVEETYQTGHLESSDRKSQIFYKRHRLGVDDLATLSGQNWLNDQIINLYGELIMDEVPDKVYFFNSFFLEQLVAKGYEGVKRWTKKVDIFEKTLLLIPTHLGVHWSLIVVDIPNQVISSYDSQGIHPKGSLKDVRKYLQAEARERNRAEFLQGWWTTVAKCVPLQENDSDCGVFVLQYCRCLTFDQPFQFTQEDMPMMRKRIHMELCECRLMD